MKEKTYVKDAALTANEIETAQAAVNRAAFILHRKAACQKARNAQQCLVKIGATLREIVEDIEDVSQMKDKVETDATQDPEPTVLGGPLEDRPVEEHPAEVKPKTEKPAPSRTGSEARKR